MADSVERHIAILETRITGEEDVRKYAAEFNRLATETRKAGQVIRQSGQEFNSFGSSFSRSIAGMGGAGIVLRNTSAQLQDFAVQVGFGTSVLQAFGQQAPQLLSAFGTFGTIAGTIVAITVALPALANAFKAVTGAAKDSAGQVGRFDETLTEFKRRIQDIDFAPKKFDAKNMIEQFNIMDASTRRMYLNLLAVNQQVARITELRNLADLQADFNEIAEGGFLDAFKGKSQNLIDEFQLNADQANELFNLFNKVNKSQEDYIRIAELTAKATTEVGRKFQAEAQSLAQSRIELGNFNKQQQELLKTLEKNVETGVPVPESGKKSGRVKAAKEELTAVQQVQKEFDEYQKKLTDAFQQKPIFEQLREEALKTGDVLTEAFALDNLIKINETLGNTAETVTVKFAKNRLELQLFQKDLQLVNEEIQRIGQPTNDNDRAFVEGLLRKKEELQKAIDSLNFNEGVDKVKNAIKPTNEPTLFEQILEDIRKSNDEIQTYPAVIKAITEELAKMNSTQLDSPIGQNLLSRRNDFIEALNKGNIDFELFKGLSDSVFNNLENTMGTLIDSFGRTKVSFGDMIDSMITSLTKFVTSFFVQKAFEALLQIGLSFFGGGAGAAGGIMNTGALTTQIGNYFPRGIGADTPGGTIEGETTFLRSNTIIPLRRGGMNGNGEVTVNVFNNGDSSVRTNSREDDKNNRVIDIYIESKVKDQFANGRMDSIMKNRFGLRRTPG